MVLLEIGDDDDDNGDNKEIIEKKERSVGSGRELEEKCGSFRFL